LALGTGRTNQEYSRERKAASARKNFGETYLEREQKKKRNIKIDEDRRGVSKKCNKPNLEKSENVKKKEKMGGWGENNMR